MNSIKNCAGKPVLLKMAAVIQENRDYPGEVDGFTGGGDHGMDINKGFTMFGEQIREKDIDFTEGLNDLGNLFFSQTGGFMGPVYGSLLMGMAETGEKFDIIDLYNFAAMLDAGLKNLQEAAQASVGDKTLIDTLAPANEAVQKAAQEGRNFADALRDMKAAAEAGRDFSKGLAAKFGRSSRLGERSRGVPDAGSVSCRLILCAMADGIIEQLGE